GRAVRRGSFAQRMGPRGELRSIGGDCRACDAESKTSTDAVTLLSTVPKKLARTSAGRARRAAGGNRVRLMPCLVNAARTACAVNGAFGLGVFAPLCPQATSTAASGHSQSVRSPVLRVTP